MKTATIQFRTETDLKQAVERTAKTCHSDPAEVSRQALRLGLEVYSRRIAAARAKQIGFGCVPKASGDAMISPGWEGWP